MSKAFDRHRFAWRAMVERDFSLSHVAFRLAFVLCELVQEKKGYAYPKIEDLKKRIHVSGSTIKRAIDELEKKGYLHVTSSRGRGHSSEYRLIGENGSRAGSFNDDEKSPRVDFFFRRKGFI